MRPVHNDAAAQQSHSSSIDGVGGRFQSFSINDLEIVSRILASFSQTAA
jgi:hypothetical protein